MKKRACIILTILALLLLQAGCRNKPGSTGAGGYRIYGVDVNETQLVEINYETDLMDPGDLTEDFFEVMHRLPAEEGSFCALPSDVEILSHELSGNRLSIDFSEQYLQMNPIRELLCRAAYVRTFTQIEGVDEVVFTVAGNPLTDEVGNEVGIMTEDTFVDNSSYSLSQYEKKVFTFYFANEAGDGLVQETREIRYSKNRPIAETVIGRLQSGPLLETSHEVIPKTAKLLGVTTRDGICYVNFDQGLLDEEPAVSDMVRIYAIVNTVADATGEDQVQIVINGESNVRFHETIDLSEPLTKNMELVAE